MVYGQDAAAQVAGEIHFGQLENQPAVRTFLRIIFMSLRVFVHASVCVCVCVFLKK